MRTAAAILERAQRAAKRHALIGWTLIALPWLAAVCALVWRIDRHGGREAMTALAILAALAAVIAAGWAWRALRRIDRPWMARRLDAQRTDMEDSAGLLLGLQAPRTPLEDLQRTRLQQRIERAPQLDLRTPWHRRRLAASAACAFAALCAILSWPAAAPSAAMPGSAMSRTPGPASLPKLVAFRLEIHPPAYTGLPVRHVSGLSAKVPVGSELRWTLRFAPDAADAALYFHDGSRLALARRDGVWRGRQRMQRAALYRIESVQGGGQRSKLRSTGSGRTNDLSFGRGPRSAGTQPQLHRIDVIADRPPRIRVLQPAATLSTLTPGQRRWAVAFEASDDYGLAATARLRIVRTEGSGENISAKEIGIALPGTGRAARRRYAHAFDLAALGLVPGDDLIVQLVVSDRAAPKPHVVAGPSLILRWPPEIGAQASGLDGMMKKVMPAYFRSQRQIIIDAEALLKEKPRLAVEKYLQRSDGIGVDQRLLRLRYGQFLGEESENAPQLPTSDAPEEAPLLPTSDAPAQASAAQGSPAEGDAHAPDDGHDHGAQDAAPQRQAVFGEETQVLERYGHTHDIPEAATLLDPKTRELLRAALDAMWLSEVELRQGHPERALPHANRALVFIKRVQQSERIYLDKVGVALPPIDASRRLKGDRAGLGDRADPLRAATPPDATPAQAWRALAPVPTDGVAGTPDLDALARWLATHDTRAGDPLALAAAIDALRRDRACAACRQRLRDQLWPLLAPPPGAPGGRKPATRSGDAYLDALGREPSR